MRHHHRAGRRRQVDYGDGPMVRHPKTGKYRRTRLFVLTLGYSRKSVRLAGLAVERADVGRAPRARVSSAGRDGARRSSSTISKRACSRPTSTIRRSIRSIATCSRTTAWSPCRVASGIRTAKAKSNPASATRRRRRCRGCASRRSTRRKPISIAGTRAGPTRASTAPRSAKWPRCLPRSSPRSARCPLEPFRYYRFGAPHRAPRWLRRSRRRLLRRAAWLDRASRRCAVERSARPAARSEDRPAAARACARAARLASHRGRPIGRTRTPPKTLALLDAALRIGPSVSAICDHIHRHEGRRRRPPHPRRARAREEARPRGHRGCRESRPRSRRADYRFLRRYLERRPPVPLTLRQVDPLIRQLTLYRDLIDRTTGDPE